ncbi:cortical patch protein [Metarhizium album ARSEF 1941]|uniref:Cortical patch protein n=1 Tax=Metarhizium album (strain ARSEF 1941) TaxID=1081103 RepID=A0A0B2X4F6_METAS|nr:cortical patch protein [Metarhizium album ARSEF 1941]KHO00186.1 cortical patch protein [Metarhizium album ARSEF 1941]
MLATSILFLFFIILSGVTDSTPLNKTYFLRANTEGITGALPNSQWTYFYICGDGNRDCTGAKAAMPFGWAWDANARNVPDELGGSYGSGTTSFHYFYMWRFGWVFILIALFFEVLAFFSGFLACCGRLGAAVAFIVTGAALVFHAIGASLFTATFVGARNAFNSAGRSAHLGSYGFGWVWGSFAAAFIALVLFALGIRGDRSAAGGAGGGMFRRNRSTRSYEGRRVKDEYS